MITPTDYISDFAYGRYVRPALERGDKTVTIDTREVCDGLGGAYSENLVGTVLGSLHFRETCCVPSYRRNWPQRKRTPFDWT